MKSRASLNPLLVIAIALAISACASPAPQDPFEEGGQVWPSPPDRPRLQFVTEFSGPFDLGIQPTMWNRLVGFTAGARDHAIVRPMAVAATPGGEVVFVADPDAGCVHRFEVRRGRYSCLVSDTGSALLSPVGLAISAEGRLFVADSASDSVYVISPGDDALSNLMLSPAPEQPTGLAVGSGGDLFVSSTRTHTIRRYNSAGRLVRDYGGRGSEAGRLNFPTYIWVTASSELLVTDTMNFRIQVFDVEDGVVTVFGRPGNTSGSLSRPKGIAMDNHGHIYVVDGGHHAMQIFDRNGQLLLGVGQQGREQGQFWLPSGVFATSDDLIFVADAYNRRVQVFRYVGGGP